MRYNEVHLHNRVTVLIKAPADCEEEKKDDATCLCKFLLSSTHGESQTQGSTYVAKQHVL